MACGSDNQATITSVEGLIIHLPSPNSPLGNSILAWCPDVGAFRVKNGHIPLQSLKLGNWFRFRIMDEANDEQRRAGGQNYWTGQKNRHNYASVGAEIIAAKFPCRYGKMADRGMFVTVSCPLVVGAVHREANRAVCFAGFFGRVEAYINETSADYMAIAKKPVETNALILATLCCNIGWKESDSDEDWAVRRFERPVVDDPKIWVSLAIGIWDATFVRFDNEEQLCFVKSDKGSESIAFGEYDFNSDAPVMFKPGYRFQVWVGEVGPKRDVLRAFYAELRSRTPESNITNSSNNNNYNENNQTTTQPNHLNAESTSDYKHLYPKEFQFDMNNRPSNGAFNPDSYSDMQKISAADSSIISNEPTKKPVIEVPNAEIQRTTQDTSILTQAIVENKECQTSDDELKCNKCLTRDQMDMGRRVMEKIFKSGPVFDSICKNDNSILSDLHTIFSSEI